MSWLARLKTGKHPDTHATKPTKPTTDPQNRGFVGFVAPLPECFQKTAVSTDAANDPTPEPRKPESERRKEIWEALYPVAKAETEVAQLAPPQFAGQLGGARPQEKAFAASTAAITGEAKRTSEAIDQVPPTPKKALATDPGKRALLALVMAYCDRTAASDKARAQWVDDVESTPPELRGDLYQHLRGQLPPPPPAASPTCQPAPAKPLPHFSMEQPWRAADRLYQNHHWQCPECMTAARAAPGTADRCTEGQRLHDEYTSEGHRP